MYRYIIYAFIMIIAVGIFLAPGKFIDRHTEKITDTEVVRENEEYPGTWASRPAHIICVSFLLIALPMPYIVPYQNFFIPRAG